MLTNYVRARGTQSAEPEATPLRTNKYTHQRCCLAAVVWQTSARDTCRQNAQVVQRKHGLSK